MPTLALLGDVMLGRGVDAAWDGRADAGAMWGDVLPMLAGADVRIANLECALTTHKRSWTCTEKVFYFRADPAMVGVLQTVHIDACSLANNHTLDFEEAGLLDTMRCLASDGIRYVGAWKNCRRKWGRPLCAAAIACFGKPGRSAKSRKCVVPAQPGE